MCRKGCSLTTAEVRSSLRSGWQHQHEPVDSCVAVKKYRWTYLWRCKKSTQQLPLCKPICHILELIKTGSAKLSVIMLHLFYQDFGKEAKSPSLTGQLRVSYLVMFCIRLGLHSQLSSYIHVSWTCFTARSGKDIWCLFLFYYTKITINYLNFMILVHWIMGTCEMWHG